MTLKELRMTTAGTRFGWSKFFEPNKRFVDYMVLNFCGAAATIYDVGCGAGHVTDILRCAGLTVVPLDLHRHSSPECEAIIADGETFIYQPDSVVMLCRPCHGGFAQGVIEQAIRCSVRTILYVGLDRNLTDDLDEHKHEFTLKIQNVGNDRESLWRRDD